jgi:hypothetical protein
MSASATLEIQLRLSAVEGKASEVIYGTGNLQVQESLVTHSSSKNAML